MLTKDRPTHRPPRRPGRAGGGVVLGSVVEVGAVMRRSRVRTGVSAVRDAEGVRRSGVRTGVSAVRGAAGSGEGRGVRLTTGWKASGSCPTGKARQHDGAARTLRNPVDELFTHESGSGTARAHTCPPLSDTRPTPAPSHRPHGRVTAAPSPRSRPRASQPHHRTPDHTRHSSTPLPTHASPHHDHRRPMPEQPLVRAEPHPRPRDLPVTGLAPQLPDQLAHLGDRLRRNRLAEGRETTARVHR
jgi:hypothetical protein